MATFHYKAVTATGEIIRGTLAASSESDVIRHLRGEGHLPIWAGSEGNGLLDSLRRHVAFGKPAPRRQLAVAVQELADLLLAGLELDRALGIMTNLRDAKALQHSFAAVRAKVRDGASLADALAAEPVFPKFTIGMVRAGEMGGVLAPTLRKLADYLTRTQAIRDAVLSALVYPVILLVTAGLSVTFILTFVLPSFEPLFAEAGRALPWPTQIVMAISTAVRDFWWLGFLLVAAAAVWFRKALGDEQFRRQWHGFLLRVPGLGPLLIDVELERFKRILGTLLASGVPLSSALRLSKDVLWNTRIAETIEETAASLREGEALARKLQQSGLFPPATLDLIEIGEETGRLDEMLLRQADHDEHRIRHHLDRLIALLVPALTIILGIIVAGLIASILVAILGVNDLALQ